MKKWVFVVAGVLLVTVVLIEVFIPSSLTVSRIEPLRCRAASVWPFLSDEARWGGWWPDSVSRADFHIQRLSYQAVDISIRRGVQEFDSRLTLFSLGNQDSSVMQWVTQLHCGWDPIDRVRQYFRATRLKEDMDRVLALASLFAEKKENLYGLDIRVGTLRDTLLITTRMEKMGMPTNEDIYAQTGKLWNYISEMHCHPTNSPMVNIATDTGRPGRYKMMVAMPVDCRLEDRGGLFFKRLIPGKYLIGEVRGGAGSVDRAFKNMDAYIRDYQLTVMAIPFQMLVTDRRQEPDSARWVTRIYYPIF
jgi:hypothetical protein